MTREALRNELKSFVWKAATSLVHGGSMSASVFKKYMLGALFYRFISENLAECCNEFLREGGHDDTDYAELDDETAENARETIVNIKGFFILPSQLFINVANRARTNTELNVELPAIFRAIENSAVGSDGENNIKGLFNSFVTNDAGLGADVPARNKTITTLLECVRDLNFVKYSAGGIDAFGVCYEHLLKMYAIGAGTKGGEFYTPPEVSVLLAKLAAAGRRRVKKVYDPACGSGSLLLKFIEILGTENITEGFFGQEIIEETYNLCRMNMFLHSVSFDRFDIRLGDTLLAPQHRGLEPFDAIVSNPPYSKP